MHAFAGESLIRRLVFSLLVLAFIVELAVVIVRFHNVAALPFDLTMASEGNLLEGGLRVREGAWQTLYPGSGGRGLVVYGYHPLYYFLLGFLMLFSYPTVLLTKVISLACLLGTLAVTFILLRGRHESNLSLFGTLVTLHLLLGFLGYPIFGTVDYPLLFLSTLLLHAALRDTGSGRHAAWMGMLAGLSFLAKQPGLFSAMAIGAYLLFTRRNLLGHYVFAFLMAAILPLWMLNLVTHGNFYLQCYTILSRVPILDYRVLYNNALAVGHLIVLPLVCVAAAAALRYLRIKPNLAPLLLLLAWICSMPPLLAKDGTTIAYFAPAVPALVALFCAAVAGLMERGLLKSAAGIALATLCFTPNAFTIQSPVVTERDYRNGERLMEWIRNTPGPVLTERHHGLLLAAQKRPEHDLSHLWWLARRLDFRADSALVKDLRSQRYNLILISEDYMLPEVKSALESRYERKIKAAIQQTRPGGFVYKFVPWIPKRATGPP